MKCESMVYLNKIFTNLEAGSCPLLGELTADGTSFTQQLSFYEPTDGNAWGGGGSCGCGCGGNGTSGCCFEFEDDLNFLIDSTQVFINDFTLTDPGALTPENVTINGIPVDTLDYASGIFSAGTGSVSSRVANCNCMEKGASTKAMLLIRDAGPWVAKVTIVVYGSVFGCGNCKKFKLILSTQDGISIDIPGSSTFAVTDVCLPCTVGGMAPVIQFSFTANASLLNPVITTDTGSGACNVILSGALVTEPSAAIQVTRQTLFNIDADMVPLPCDDLRRCLQAPGTCTRAAEPMPISNPCCDDGCGFSNATEADDGTANGCGCGCDCDPGCDCENNCQRDTQPRQICCQFNGCNGCSL